MEELKKLYEDNKDFRDYVDRFAKSREITIDEALTHKILIEEISKIYKE